ncbi:MAG TPA: hypothetical protein VF220_08730 [Nitrososphaeraceae archaeon]
MLIQVQYHLIHAIFYFAGFIVPIYFILKSRSKKIERDLVKFMILLASFMSIQFIYHITGTFDLRLLSKGILEPISAAALTIFSIVYFFAAKKMKKEEACI